MSIEMSWLHDDEHEQGQDSGQATSDGVIAVAAFAVVLVNDRK